MQIKSHEQYEKFKTELISCGKQREEIRSALEKKGYTEAMIAMALLFINEMYYSYKSAVDEFERFLSGQFDPDSTALMNLGSHLIKIRLSKGLSQADLANKLGVTELEVWKLERDNYSGASIRIINSVMNALGIEKLAVTPSPDEETRYYQQQLASESKEDNNNESTNTI
ncbi:helix-turn-helix domain-containing protein [Laceyella tengchongensis]|uniref:helix-turn-helix domain-containing protein n=1 Tax=Laceyella tengchongensis TaxID=574699 RepID=UPI0012B8B071|nr:hypothetical protein [Laceyella tengchongensis]